MAVESYGENNLTASIATASLPMERRGANHYWLGLASLDDLKTNTLESAAGTLVSQYSGNDLNNSIVSTTITFVRRRQFANPFAILFTSISPTLFNDN